jgi:hypothetical protein
VFPAYFEVRISPRTYICRHYPLRTVEQALRKIRRFAFNPEHQKRSYHYLQFSGNPDEFFLNPKRLARYDDDHVWDFTERLETVRAELLSRALRRAHSRAAKFERAHRMLSRDYAALELELEALRAEAQARAGGGEKER